MKSYFLIILALFAGPFTGKRANPSGSLSLTALAEQPPSAAMFIAGRWAKANGQSTVSTPNLIITQGLLQPNSATTTSVITPKLQVTNLVYPNHQSDMVQLKTPSPKGGSLSYMLMDMNGKIIVKQDITLAGGESIQSIFLPRYGCRKLYVASGRNPAGERNTTTYKIQKIQ